MYLVKNYSDLPSNLDTKKAFVGLLELEKKERTLKKRDSYTKAYIVSVLFPPMGIFYLGKFLFFSDGTSEDIKAGIISFVLTIITLLVSILISVVFFKQVTKSIPPSDMNTIQEFITPENMDTYKKLMQ